jgi:aminoglycoside 3-N-acetyltransferase
MKFHYSVKDLEAALEQLPLNWGDVIFVHANIGFFGRADGETEGNALCRLFFDALMHRLGDAGTIVVPTFTYSYPRSQVFNPRTTASEMGLFAEWIRLHPNAKRSCDPSYSVAAIGEKAEMLTTKIPENSFGRKSFFDRFLAVNGIILNFNLDAGSTFLHFLEREINVPYRFDKIFDGLIVSDINQTKQTKNTIYVRYLHEATLPNFENFHKLAIKENKIYTVNLGRGMINLIRARDCQAIINTNYSKDPWFLTRASSNIMLQNMFKDNFQKLLNEEQNNAKI